jgi:hypothetical protein
MAKLDHLETSSNYDIAMDFYQSLMHFITNKKGTHVQVDAIIDNLKLIYDTDETPIAVKIRKANEQS